MLTISFRDPRPLYEQIVDGIRHQVFAGVLEPDAQLPSVRELSSQLAVNPNTIQRAYHELEQEGCIYLVRGKGSFVADTARAGNARRLELLTQFDALVKELQVLGVSTSELSSRIKEVGHDA